MTLKTSIPFIVIAVSAALPVAKADATKLPRLLNGVGIHQNLNAQAPLDIEFQDETGSTVPLRKFFESGKPVLLAPVYYRCPMLCGQILNGVVAGLRPLSLKPGRDFQIVAVSFNPVETPDDARNKRDFYSKRYSSTAGPNGWNFLVGQQASIQKLMQAIGFKYRWDEKNKMFVHASGIMILTPQGKIARYLYGVEYQPKDLKLSLVEASNSKIGSPVDQILLFCYHYDPKTGKYGAVVINMLQIAAGLVLGILVLALFLLWRRDLRQNRNALKEAPRT